MKIGSKLLPAIDRAIGDFDKLLLVLSQESIQSEWVETEVEAAFDKERNSGQTVLFPIRIDNSVMDSDQSWAKKIKRSRHIGDFTSWQSPAEFQQAFDRLIRDLQASESPAPSS